MLKKNSTSRMQLFESVWYNVNIVKDKTNCMLHVLVSWNLYHHVTGPLYWWCFFPKSEITSRYLRWDGCDRSRTRGLQCWRLCRCTQGFQLLYTCTFLDEVNFEWVFRMGRITFCLSDSSYYFWKIW
jgi:hypothetical protein